MHGSDNEHVHRQHDAFARLVTDPPFGVYVVDAQFRLSLVSAGARPMFAGIDPLIGRDFADVLRLAWPDARATEAIARFRHTLATGEPHHAPSGWRIERIVQPDGAYGVLCHFSDATTLRRVEAIEHSALADLNRLSSRLWQMPDLQAGLGEVVAGAIALLGADMGHVQLLDELGEALVVRAHRGFDAAVLERIAAVTVSGDGAAGRTPLGGERLVVEDVETDEACASLRPAARAAGYRALVSTPLVGRSGQPLGVLSAHFRSPHRPDEQHLRLLGLYARQAAGFVERLQADAALTRYRTLFDTIDEGFCIIEFFDGPHGPLSDYVHVEANPAYERHAGIPNVVGQKVREMVPDEADGWVELYRRVLLTGEPIRFERELVATGRHLELSSFRVEPASRRQVAVLFQDVTPRKRAEEALRVSDERLRVALAAARMVTWQWDPAANRSVFSDNAAEVFGLPAGATLTAAADFDPLLHPDDLEGHRATIARAMAEGGRYATQFRMIRPDTGETIWLEERGQAVADAQGNVVRLVGLDVDITDRKRAESALREREERFRQMADSIPQLAWYADADGSITWYNRRWYDYTGTTPEQMERWGWQRVLDEAVVPRVLERWAAAIASGQPFELEFPIRGADGTFRPFLTRIAPLRDEAGTVVQWFGTNTDVTDQHRAAEALRASEQRLRQMADTMAHMIWVTRPDGYHEWYNRRWYEYTGVPQGSTDGEAWNGMFHPEDQARAWARWRHSLDTGDYYEIEYRLRHHSGEYRWVLGRAMPIRNDRGEIERWFGTCTDIHAMRQLVDEREHLLQSEQAARVESERASRMKDDFLATLSHEIRTPLNAILGWATILRSGQPAAGGGAQGLEAIERNARVQAQMIDDLLDMSRIISGKLRLDVQRIDLADVIRAAAETVAPAAAAKDIRVQLVLDPRAGPVSGDPHRLQQVFWNLLSNAIKFTAKGGRVQTLLERVNSHLEISVSDTGEGIDPAFLPHVFDRFRQADATTTRVHGGLGLGLAIVKQVVELHGGTIRAKSPGRSQGSTFIVSLPLTVIHPEVASLPPRRHPTAAPALVTVGDAVRIAGVRVLVVDDEPDARALLRRLFEEREAVVSTASSAEEALAVLQAELPDVLISDIGMADEDGYTLIRRVRELSAERGGRTPAIALTAYARAEDRVKAVLAGFQHHLSKPIEPVELIVMVASMVNTR